jgi:hypothetical protein
VPAGVPDRRRMQFDHLSFNLRTSTPFTSCKACGCEVTDVIDHKFIHSIYCNDPNGIALEASWTDRADRRLRRPGVVLRPVSGAHGPRAAAHRPNSDGPAHDSGE